MEPENHWPEPDATNAFLAFHALPLIRSFRHFTGRDLISPNLLPEEASRALFEAPFVVVSHNAVTSPDEEPIFNYGNRAALHCFEMTWPEFTRLPSRLSAEPVHQAERQCLLDEVTRNGFIADYRGVRIAKSGRRFVIEAAIVWNLRDEAGRPYGQAATFDSWRDLPPFSDEE